MLMKLRLLSLSYVISVSSSLSMLSSGLAMSSSSASSLSILKNNIRKDIKNRLKLLSSTEIEEQSSLVTKSLYTIPCYQKVCLYLYYVYIILILLYLVSSNMYLFIYE
jgi:hypothetical protein